MNIKNYLIVGLLLCASLTHAQKGFGVSSTSSSCTSCADPDGDITSLGANQFEARTAQAYFWEVCQGTAEIQGSHTSQIVTLSTSSGSNTRLKLVRFKNGECIESCETIISPPCTASVKEIYCNPSNGPYSAQYPTRVNSRLELKNPFNTSARVTYSWNPAFYDGLQLAGGILNDLGANVTTIKASQFAINANGSSSNNPNGFYVPMKVVYTNKSTGETCTVYLNPLLEPCDDDGHVGDQFTESDDNTSSKSHVFPNPYTLGRTLTIDSKSKVESVKLVDMNGNVLHEYQTLNNKFQMNERIDKGIYFLKYVENRKLVTKRIIIK